MVHNNSVHNFWYIPINVTEIMMSSDITGGRTLNAIQHCTCDNSHAISFSKRTSCCVTSCLEHVTRFLWVQQISRWSYKCPICQKHTQTETYRSVHTQYTYTHMHACMQMHNTQAQIDRQIDRQTYVQTLNMTLVSTYTQVWIHIIYEYNTCPSA